MIPLMSYGVDIDGSEERETSRLVLFASAVGLMFLIAATPVESLRTILSLLVDRIHSSPDVSAFLAGISRKFATGTRDGVVELLVDSVAVPFKKVGFIFSFATLLYFPLRTVRRAPWLWVGWKERLRKAATLCLTLAVLAIPFQLRSLGDSYARMSFSPFDEPFGILYRRVLMPALANTIGASGYLFYLLLSILVTVLLVYLVLAWFDKNGVQLSFVALLSLFTCSFVLYGFEMPGYPDQLAMIFLLLMVTLPASRYVRVSLVALSLAAHEASIVMILPAALFMFSKHEMKGVFLIVAAYALFMLIGMGFDVRGLFTAHARFDASGYTAWDYLRSNPFMAVLGVFVAFKVFWGVALYASAHAWKSGERATAGLILACILIPLALVPFAVDASRFSGFGFPGILMALRYMSDHSVTKSATLNAVSTVNLLIPSMYVGLNSGMMFAPGLYALVYRWLM